MSTTIKLGPETLKLVTMTSPSLALALLRNLEVSPEMTSGAALALACPALARKAAIKINYADLLDSGRQMFDFLVERLVASGMSGHQALEEVARAGGEAVVHILDGLPKEDEVDEAEKRSGGTR